VSTVDSTIAFSGVYVLVYPRLAPTTFATPTRIPVPHRLAVSQAAITLRFKPEGTVPLPPFYSSVWFNVYATSLEAGCLRERAVARFELTASTGNISITPTAFDNTVAASAEVQLCVTGSPVLSTTFVMVSTIIVDGTTLESQAGRRYAKALAAGVSLMLNVTTVANVDVSRLQYSVCDRSAAESPLFKALYSPGIGLTVLAASADALSAATDYQGLLCVTIPSLDTRIAVNYAIGAMALKTLGTTSGTGTSAAVNVWSPWSGRRYATVFTGFVPSGSQLFTASGTDCVLLGSQVQVEVSSSTTVIDVPSTWFAASTSRQLCVSIAEQGSSPLSPWVLNALSVTSIRPTYDVQPPIASNTPFLFLATHAAVVEMKGTFLDRATAFGYIDTSGASQRCVAVATFNYEGSEIWRASANATLLPTEGDLCVRTVNDDGSSFFNASKFYSITATSVGGIQRAQLSLTPAAPIPVVVMTSTTESRVLEVSLSTMPEAWRALLLTNNVVFGACVAGGPTVTSKVNTSNNGTSDVTRAFLVVTATAASASEIPLCWRMPSHPPTAGYLPFASLYVFPTVAATNPVTPAINLPRLPRTYTIQWQSPPSDIVMQAVKVAVGLFAGTSCPNSATAVASTVEATLTSGRDSTTVNLTAPTSGTHSVCVGLGPAAYPTQALVFSNTVGTVRLFQLTIDGGVTLPPLTGGTTIYPVVNSGTGSAPSSAIVFSPALRNGDSLQLAVVPGGYNCDNGIERSQPLFAVNGGSISGTGLSSATYVINAQLLSRGVFSGSDINPICVQLNSDQRWMATSVFLRIISLVSSTNSTSSNTTQSNATYVKQTGISMLLGATREYMLQGNDMDVALSWSLKFYTNGGVNSAATCASIASAVTVVASRVMSNNVTFVFTFNNATSYTAMCLAAEISQGTYTYTYLNASAIVIPITSFQTAGGSSITGSLKAIAGVHSKYRINGAPLASSSFVMADDCAVSTVSSAAAIALPIRSDSAGYYVETPSSASDKTYSLCLVVGSSSMTLRQTSTSVSSYDTGMKLVFASIDLNGFKPGSGQNMGHFRGSSLELNIGGASTFLADDTYTLGLFLADTACDTASRIGALPSGLPRTVLHVESCGGSTSSVIIPAATNFTTTPLRICFIVEDLTDTLRLETVIIDTNITLTVTSADRLAFVTPLPSTTSVETEFSVFPTLSLVDAQTGVSLSTLPFDLEIRARWFVVSPIVKLANDVTYLAYGTKGSLYVDFSQANLRHPGVFGYEYVLEFSAINRQDIAAINSSRVIRANCFTDTLWAQPYADTCVACPKNAACNGSQQFNVSGSYWRPGNLSGDTFSCGTPYGTEACTSGTELGTCKPGYTGPRCALCEDGYGKSITECAKCDDASDWLVVILAICFVVVVMVILTETTLRCRKSDQLPIYLKVLITHTMTAATLGQASLLMPKFVTSYFEVQKFISRPTPEFASFDCLFHTSFYDKFVLVSVSPVAFSVAVAVVLVIRLSIRYCLQQRHATTAIEASQSAKFAKEAKQPSEIAAAGSEGNQLSTSVKLDPNALQEFERPTTAQGHVREDVPVTEEDRKLQRKQSMQLRKSLARQSGFHFFMIVMVVFLFFGYPTLIEWGASVMRCDEFTFLQREPDGTELHVTKRLVYFDRRYNCEDTVPKTYRLAGTVLVCVWGFGIPLVSVLLFLRLRASIGRILASRMFTFVIAGYRSSVWWWEVVLMMRKFAIIMIVSFIDDSRLQALISFWVLALHLVAHLIVCPYEYKTVDKMETASLYVLCATLNLSLLFDWVNIDAVDDIKIVVGAYALSALIMVLNIGIILWMLKNILFEAKSNLQRQIRDNRQWIEANAPCCGARIVAFGFAALREEVVAPALGVKSHAEGSEDDNGDGDRRIEQMGVEADGSTRVPKRPTAAGSLARIARNANTSTIMVIEDDSASDWSDTSSTVEGDAEDADALKTEETFAALRMSGQLRKDVSAPLSPSNPNADGSGVFVRVTDYDRHVDAYRLSQSNDGAAMSGAFTPAEIRRQAGMSNLIDGIDNIAVSMAIGSSDDDQGDAEDAPALGGGPRVKGGFGSASFSTTSQGKHDPKQCMALIATLKITMATLRHRAEALGTENAELKAQVEHLERQCANLAKQLTVGQEYGGKLEAQVQEQLRVIEEVQKTVARLESENAHLRASCSEIEQLRADNFEISQQREQLQSQMRSARSNTSVVAGAADTMSVTLRDWHQRTETTARERDAQLQILKIEADLRQERIVELQRKEREEQQRLVAEQLELKRIARAARARRPATDQPGAARTNQDRPPLSLQSPLSGSVQSRRTFDPNNISAAFSPSSSRAKISFRRPGGNAMQLQSTQAFTAEALHTSQKDQGRLDLMQSEGAIPAVDSEGRPVVVIHKKRAEKLEPHVRRAFSMRK
jgi:uncharacterized protein (DUF983 family)